MKKTTKAPTYEEYRESFVVPEYAYPDLEQFPELTQEKVDEEIEKSIRHSYDLLYGESSQN